MINFDIETAIMNWVTAQKRANIQELMENFLIGKERAEYLIEYMVKKGILDSNGNVLMTNSAFQKAYNIDYQTIYNLDDALEINIDGVKTYVFKNVYFARNIYAENEDIVAENIIYSYEIHARNIRAESIVSARRICAKSVTAKHLLCHVAKVKKLDCDKIERW